MRRILQASGAELVHLGHNRSAKEVVFEGLIETVKVVSLRQITSALYNVGGQYRRSV